MPTVQNISSSKTPTPIPATKAMFVSYDRKYYPYDQTFEARLGAMLQIANLLCRDTYSVTLTEMFSYASACRK